MELSGPRSDARARDGFRELLVYRRALELGVEALRLADTLLAKRRFALADQLQRAAISVASNIAEGDAMRSRIHHLHFLALARGSLNEIGAQLDLATHGRILEESDTAVAFDLLSQTGRLLTLLSRAIARGTSRSRR